jgi:predicted nucleic acid-binding protein
VDFLDRLDRGEAAAISLAVEHKADLVLIDEREGTELAQSLGLETRGTLAVLAIAGGRGEIDFDRAIEILTTQTLFRFTPELIEAVRQLHDEIRHDLG